MGFLDAVRTCFSKYADFSGRASRSEFWYWSLFGALVVTFAGLLGPVVAGLVLLALMLPSYAVGVRRLHDRDQTGWWVLAPVASSVLVSLVSPETDAPIARHLVMIVVGLAAIAANVVVFVWYVRRGTKGKNRFGVDPLLDPDTQSARPDPDDSAGTKNWPAGDSWFKRKSD
ncbi:MAG: DUF805 domain-containing protein [Paracoccaceae bacterium]